MRDVMKDHCRKIEEKRKLFRVRTPTSVIRVRFAHLRERVRFAHLRGRQHVAQRGTRIYIYIATYTQLHPLLSTIARALLCYQRSVAIVPR